jgi:hypothetical protein
VELLWTSFKTFRFFLPRNFLLVPSSLNMLPKFLQSSYKRYTADTETITTFLATEGAKCGVDDTSSTTSDTNGSTATKSKVRLRQPKIWARAIAKSKNQVPKSVNVTH